jgi:myo-inositol-1-phosphate synthase
LALNHKLSGAIEAPSAYFMKSPPRQYTDEEARVMTEEFIQKHRRRAAPSKTRKKARR